MKTLLAILFAAAIWQGCNGCGADSMDEGTSRGNDTITTEDRYGSDNDVNDNVTGNSGSGIDSSGTNPNGEMDSSITDSTGN